ncbi:MAG: DUF1284 domain-containing protein [Thermoleophilia bacterium]
MQGFRGQGYSPQFIANLARVIHQLGKNREQTVRLVAGVDDICRACPHINSGDCKCPDHDVSDLDLRVAGHIGMAPGESCSWSDMLAVIGNRVTPDDILRLCSGCRWVGFGYCEQGIAALSGIPVAGTAEIHD